MMSGYVDGGPAPVRPVRRYEVQPRGPGWCVAVNGCRTRALADRKAAAALARALQREADRLAGRRGTAGRSA